MSRYVIVRDSDQALLESCAHTSRWTHDRKRAKVFTSLAEATLVCVCGEHVVEVHGVTGGAQQTRKEG